MEAPSKQPGLGRVKRRVKKAAAALLLAIALTAIGYCPTGYLVVFPGPVSSLKDLVTVDGETYQGNSIFMVAVLAREARILDLARAAFDQKVDLWSRDQVLGDMTIEDYINRNRQLMDQSKETAILLAMRMAEKDGRSSISLPSAVSIESREVSGPSAGLAFALEVYSRLTGIDLAGTGGKVAATGVVSGDGRIGPVGGIVQKVFACRSAGIDVFLVPRENLPEALKYAKGITIIGVSSFEEAVKALRSPPD